LDQLDKLKPRREGYYQVRAVTAGSSKAIRLSGQFFSTRVSSLIPNLNILFAEINGIYDSISSEENSERCILNLSR
jgi:hypothetical protein